MKSPFLSARWNNLIMANYIVEEELLKPFLPPNTMPDSWHNRHYVSLVGFVFDDTRVMGWHIPGHIQFPEVNLRIYIKQKEKDEWKRGVVFIKEIVPKPAIAWVANTLFRERYSAMPMKFMFDKSGNRLSIGYKWKYRGQWNRLQVEASPECMPVNKGSEEEFITEHYWGYADWGNGKTAVYQVEHPRWNIHPVTGIDVQCNFEALYGKAFAGLSERMPDSVLLAQGSPVRVHYKKIM